MCIKALAQGPPVKDLCPNPIFLLIFFLVNKQNIHIVTNLTSFEEFTAYFMTGHLGGTNGQAIPLTRPKSNTWAQGIGHLEMASLFFSLKWRL